ncbi:MAG: 8-oxo-dGTP diphosphatase [Thiomicrorhabdus sp.]|nr:MAG: 8-oxo-dGTP diphosphatase [Thiomicrorhabdus sp.]
MEYKEIVIGVLKRKQTVCLCLRQREQSFAGCWEFPGGKVEVGESLTEALQREFTEELGFETEYWSPLITVPWRYDTDSVRLNVFVTECAGDKFTDEVASDQITGREGQQVKWLAISKLQNINFPQANRGVVMALQLADRYMISGRFNSEEDALSRLKKAFNMGIKLCQLRAKSMAEVEFISLAKQAIQLAHQFEASILLNGSPELLSTLPEADGIQLASNVIFDYETRPIAKDKLLGVSTHTKAEIEQALKIGADFILLSPVKETCSHPGVPGIGWPEFAKLVKEIPVPVFALGGMKPIDIETAKLAGGQGIAAISGFWPSCDD